MNHTPTANSEATAHETMSLDGSWQVIFDYDNKGRTLRWQEREQFESYHDIEEVAVPACLEEFRQDYEGAAWYGKRFDLPAGLGGQDDPGAVRGGQLPGGGVGQRRGRGRA